MTTSPQQLPVFSMEFIIGISEILAQTDYPGLTNREIGMLLQMVKIDSRPEGYNKRDGLFIALNNKQAKQQMGNCVAAFIKNAMSQGATRANPSASSSCATNSTSSSSTMDTGSTSAVS